MNYIQINQMDRSGRLDTQTLIKQCRNGFDAYKLKERVKELDLTLQLRNKELQILTTKIKQCKQQAQTKVSNLEENIGKLQRQIADMRIAVIKTKRTQNQRAETQIKFVRQQCKKQLQAQQQKFLKFFGEQQEKYIQQIRRTDYKTLQLNQLNKQENVTLKTLKQQKYASIEAYAKSLESEKSQLLLNKRDAQKKIQNLKQIYDRMKAQYEASLTKKQQQLIQLKGQLQGLRLKERFQAEKLQEQRRDISQIKINNKYDQQQLILANQKLLKEKQLLSELLDDKNNQLLQIIQLGNKSLIDRISLPPVQPCQHIGLINQLQRSIELKDMELSQLKAIVQEWSEKIGFNQSVSARYQQLLTISQRAQKAKINQSKALKDRNRNLNSSRKFK